MARAEPDKQHGTDDSIQRARGRAESSIAGCPPSGPGVERGRRERPVARTIRVAGRKGSQTKGQQPKLHAAGAQRE